MRRRLLLMAVLVTIGPIVNAQSLSLVDRVTYSIDTMINFEVPITALMLGGDSTISGSGAGIYFGAGRDARWRKIIACRKGKPGQWWETCYNKERLDSLFSPTHLWRAPGTNEIVVFDKWCILFLTIDVSEQADSGLKVWGIRKKCNWAYEAALQESLLIAQTWEDDGRELSLMRVDSNLPPRTIFKIPKAVRARLDTVGYGSPNCFAAFSPHDTTIWVDIDGDDSICVIDLDGAVVGRLPIYGADFVSPSPPRSRIKSTPVYRDWLSRWTPTTSFQYAAPGYFILQYRVGWQAAANDSIPLLTTLVWSADRKPVELEIDHRWQLAGVQPDGRIIFGHYDVTGDSCRVVLEVARILP